MKSIVKVSPGLDVLPPFVRRFIQQKKLPIPYLIPVRRNCLSGSGRKNECHSNSYALAKRFGGEAINGYSISVLVKNHKFESIYFTDHTVWKTPENRLVDVTAHNFSEKSLGLFAPVSSLLDKTFIFPSFHITPDYLRTGLMVDFGHSKLNSIVRETLKVKETSVSPSRSMLLIPASRMTPELFTIPWDKFTESELADLYETANFSLPSTATGKYWNEIIRTNNNREV